MQATESCGASYPYRGDMKTCWLDFNHDGDCGTANRLADLEARTRAAIDHWVF